MEEKKTITRLEVIEQMIKGTHLIIKAQSQADAQIVTLLKYNNMSVHRLAKMVKLPENVVRRFKRINKEYKII